MSFFINWEGLKKIMMENDPQTSTVAQPAIEHTTRPVLPDWAYTTRGRISPAGALFMRFAWREGQAFQRKDYGLFGIGKVQVVNVVQAGEDMVVFAIVSDKAVMITDPFDMFPSDELVTKIKVLM